MDAQYGLSVDNSPTELAARVSELMKKDFFVFPSDKKV
jgi:hypothetical protein